MRKEIVNKDLNSTPGCVSFKQTPHSYLKINVLKKNKTVLNKTKNVLDKNCIIFMQCTFWIRKYVNIADSRI